jgi:LysM repeat protein
VQAAHQAAVRLYDRRAMVRRNRARYLAPIALVAAITGTYLIVHEAMRTKQSTAPPQHVVRQAPARRTKFAKARFYTVQPSDTLINISNKTGVSVATLEALNRAIVDPNSLQTGQRLRLRR